MWRFSSSGPSPRSSIFHPAHPCPHALKSRALSPSSSGPQLPLAAAALLISRRIEGTVFGPDEIAVMVGAYETALRDLDVSGHGHPKAVTLVKTIVMLAKQGERDPEQLCEAVLQRWRAATPRVPPPMVPG